MKTIKRFKIALAAFCTLLAIGLCIAVYKEWSALGCTKTLSIVAECIVYCAGCVGLYIGGKELAEFIDYWWGNGDIYYKGRKQ